MKHHNVKYLQCGQEFKFTSASHDGYGWHASCPKCDSSFDIDLPNYSEELQGLFDCCRVTGVYEDKGVLAVKYRCDSDDTSTYDTTANDAEMILNGGEEDCIQLCDSCDNDGCNKRRTPNYTEYETAVKNLSLPAIVRAVEYIITLAEITDKDNKILEDMEYILEPFRGVTEGLRTERICPRCGGFWYKSDLAQYDYVCVGCDENF